MEHCLSHWKSFRLLKSTLLLASSHCQGYRVLGFGFRVLGFGFFGLGFWVLGFGFVQLFEAFQRRGLLVVNVQQCAAQPQ